MSQPNTSLKKVEPQAIKTLQTDLEKLLPALNQALPETMKRYLTPERVVKVAMLAIRKSPLLAQCTRESIFQGIMDSASLGLDVGGMLGHAYLVPFKNNKKGIYEAQLIIGYKGYIGLARRSGEVLSVKAEVVYEKDEFDVDLASGDLPHHKPFLKGDRGAAYLVYCVARFRDGGNHTEIMTLSDCEKIRQRSRAKDAGPWANKDDYLEMCKKTVTRRAAKYWPLSADTAVDIAKGEEADRDRFDDLDLSDKMLTAVYSQNQDPQPAQRVDEVLAKIQGDNPETGETTWAGGPEDHQAPVYTAENIAMADEELLALVRIRWGQLMPEYSTDKDILQALAGLGVKHTALSQFSVADCQKILDHVDRPRPQAQA